MLHTKLFCVGKMKENGQNKEKVKEIRSRSLSSPPPFSSFLFPTPKQFSLMREGEKGEGEGLRLIAMLPQSPRMKIFASTVGTNRPTSFSTDGFAAVFRELMMVNSSTSLSLPLDGQLNKGRN